MSGLPTTFAELIHPLSVDEFMTQVLHKKPLHIPGGAEKVAGLMDWAAHNRILGIGGYWTGRQLQLALDTKQILPERYCRPAPTLEGERLMADPVMVQAFLAEGASLVANTVDGLTPELNQIAGILEDTFMASAQGNLYCSSKARQAFDTHFDTHDVFALHTEGEKIWRIYDAKLKMPLNHPALAPASLELAKQAQGKLLMEVTMRPGDLLYIPRGQYHDAIATSNNCIHVAFGVIPMRSYELIALLENEAVADPALRADLPADAAEFGAALDDLGHALAGLLKDPEVRDRLRKAQSARRRSRAAYDVLHAAKSVTYRRATDTVRLKNTAKGWALSDGKQNALIPPGTSDLVNWVLTRAEFTRAELDAEFSHRADTGQIIATLEAMGVIRKA